MAQNNFYTTFTHRIDKNGKIISISENWLSFAQENQGSKPCFSENIIGSSLWDHIHDRETKHLYEIIVQKVLKSNRQASFSFRCDSPEKRRFLKLTVIPLQDGSIEFISQIIRTETREPVEYTQIRHYTIRYIYKNMQHV